MMVVKLKSLSLMNAKANLSHEFQLFKEWHY